MPLDGRHATSWTSWWRTCAAVRTPGTPPLILKAGEIARDLSFALRIDPVVIALAAGSPLDDLDEALRSADAGGVGCVLRQAQAPEDSGTAVISGVAHHYRQDLRGRGLARLATRMVRHDEGMR